MISTAPGLNAGRRATAFAVVARSRSGSNFLIDLLNSNRSVFCYWEIFSDKPEEEVEAIWRKWRSPKPFFIRAVGCKIFYYHPRKGADSKLWRMLEDDAAVRFLHLRRENILETLISRKLANMTGRWTRFAGDPEADSVPVHMSAEELERGFAETRAWERSFEERYKDHPILQLTYEELVADPTATMDRVFEFLDVPSAPVSSPMQKQNVRSPSACLANWDELRSHFQNTHWSPFFR